MNCPCNHLANLADNNSSERCEFLVHHVAEIRDAVELRAVRATLQRARRIHSIELRRLEQVSRVTGHADAPKSIKAQLGAAYERAIIIELGERITAINLAAAKRLAEL